MKNVILEDIRDNRHFRALWTDVDQTNVLVVDTNGEGLFQVSLDNVFDGNFRFPPFPTPLKHVNTEAI